MLACGRVGSDNGFSPTPVPPSSPYKSQSEQTLPFQLFVPPHYDSKISYPLIVWLHGSGEVGDDNEKQMDNGAEVFTDEKTRAQYPGFFLAPQCPENDRWSNMSSRFPAENNRMSTRPTATAQSTFELIEKLKTIYNIDRVIVIGFSMGGFGAWDWIVRRPDLFVKAIPMSAGGDITKASNLIHTPIWAFHGNRDDTVGVSHSRAMIQAIRRSGGQPLYTEISGGGHGPWAPNIADATTLAWIYQPL